MLIYIVEDDPNIRQMEAYALKNSGFDVCEFTDAKAFFEACVDRLPDLAVLDIMLPQTDGAKILAQMKKSPQMKNVPVIMVTARSSELDTVRCLDCGADDYITKPFGIMAFISRVKAVLRRVGHEKEAGLSIGGIELRDDTHTVTASGEVCELTYKEYELLKYLLINHGIVLSRDKLMENVWGTDYKGESRTVDVHIKSLRQKLGGCGAMIQTVRNVGYKLNGAASNPSRATADAPTKS